MPRDHKVTIRLEEADAETLMRAAATAGKPVSTFIADMAKSLAHQHEPRDVPNQPHQHESARALDFRNLPRAV